MNQEPDLIEFDDSEAIEFILKHLPEEITSKVSDDDIQYVLDLITLYYDERNLWEEDEVMEAEIAEDDMFDQIWATIEKEKIVTIDKESLEAILLGEYEYGKALGIYTEEEE